MKYLENKKFGKLTVKNRVGSNRSGSILWECICDCGTVKHYSNDHLTRKSNPVKSCGCLRKSFKGAGHPQWKGTGRLSAGWFFTHIARNRNITKRQQLPVTVTIEYLWDLFIKQEGKCALSGLELELNGNHCNNTASVDRIDSSKGYEPENVQWVHKHINFMKSTYTQEYFIKMCKRVSDKYRD